MKRLLQMILFVPVLLIAGCKENSSRDKSSDSKKTDRSPADVAMRRSMENGDYIRQAGNDHSLPPYIRQSAKAFGDILDGGDFGLKEAGQAGEELASTRNLSTFRIWLSFMLSLEKQFPERFPTSEEMRAINEQYRSDPESNSKKVNPLVILEGYFSCIERLTEFDMEEADVEVGESIIRFKNKYGSTDEGIKAIHDLENTVKSAKNVRATDRVRWKQGRNPKPSNKGID